MRYPDMFWLPDYSCLEVADIFPIYCTNHETQQNIWTVWRNSRTYYNEHILNIKHGLSVGTWLPPFHPPPSTSPSPHPPPAAFPEWHIVSSQTSSFLSPTMTSLVTSETPWILADPGNEVTTLECEREDHNYTPTPHNHPLLTSTLSCSHPPPVQHPPTAFTPFSLSLQQNKEGLLLPHASPHSWSMTDGSIKSIKTWLSNEVTVTFTDQRLGDVRGRWVISLHHLPTGFITLHTQ